MPHAHLLGEFVQLPVSEGVFASFMIFGIKSGLAYLCTKQFELQGKPVRLFRELPVDRVESLVQTAHQIH